ncbi:hypothetical protein ABXJ76_14610 [Methylobacter sp. G7]|uniref:hypothetical protein n=1 Tax=Methylobacter sp. G7 TaxID=3230117 RepID=UPI003D8009B9
MTEEQLQVIQWEIENVFYYVSYPDNIAANLWKDGGGNINFMDEMTLDHLKASIKKIESDIKKLKLRRRGAVSDAIVPLAEQKIDELNEVFQLKAKA